MVQVNVNLNGLNAIAKVGIAQPLFDWLKSAGVKVKLTATEFRLILGDTVQSVPVTLDQIHALNAGNLSVAAKSLLRNDLTAAITTLKGALPVTETLPGGGALHYDPASATVVALGVEDAPAAPTLAKDGALAILPPIETAVEAIEKTVVPAGVFGVFNVAMKDTAKPVNLAIASQLYQPVNGTSPGSRYWVVGANEDIRVAARYQGGELSMRIEGPNWSKYEANLAKVGFNKISKVKGYASLHLAIGHDKMVAAKALGAILMGLGVQLKTPLPQLDFVTAA